MSEDKQDRIAQIRDLLLDGLVKDLKDDKLTTSNKISLLAFYVPKVRPTEREIQETDLDIEWSPTKANDPDVDEKPLEEEPKSS